MPHGCQPYLSYRPKEETGLEGLVAPQMKPRSERKNGVLLTTFLLKTDKRSNKIGGDERF